MNSTYIVPIVGIAVVVAAILVWQLHERKEKVGSSDVHQENKAGSILVYLLFFLLLIGYAFYVIAPYIPYGMYAPDPNRSFIGFTF